MGLLLNDIMDKGEGGGTVKNWPLMTKGALRGGASPKSDLSMTYQGEFGR